MEENLIVGRVEKVYLPIAKKEIRAKIDTGAMTSSLSVVIVEKSEQRGLEGFPHRATVYSPSGMAAPSAKRLQRRYPKGEDEEAPMISFYLSHKKRNKQIIGNEKQATGYREVWDGNLDLDGGTQNKELLPVKSSLSPSSIITLPMIDQRFVKSSCGEKRFRPVVSMPIVIGEKQWLIEVTLTNRSSMRYPMLIGRQALVSGRCIVDASRAYIT